MEPFFHCTEWPLRSEMLQGSVYNENEMSSEVHCWHYYLSSSDGSVISLVPSRETTTGTMRGIKWEGSLTMLINLNRERECTRTIVWSTLLTRPQGWWQSLGIAQMRQKMTLVAVWEDSQTPLGGNQMSSEGCGLLSPFVVSLKHAFELLCCHQRHSWHLSVVAIQKKDHSDF